MKRARRFILPTAAVMLVALAVVGCGSSSSTSSPSNASANASATSASGRRAAIEACLKKQGINLPQRPPGAPRRGGRGLFGGGGAGGPNNPNAQKIRQALQKCGINFPFRGRRFNSPAYRAAINKFVACVRRNGFNLPAPNLSGSGPVFDPSKVNRNDPKFVAAAKKCSSVLPRRGFGPPGGTYGGGSGTA